MNKIPVGRTISETYRFAFGRYLPILGVVWLPLAVTALIGYFLISPAYSNYPQVMHDMVQHALQKPPTPYVMPPEFARSMNIAYSVAILSYLLIALMVVGVTKEALGLRTGLRFVYINFGTSELLVIGGWIAIVAIIYAGSLVVGIVGGIIGIVFAIFLVGHGADMTPAATFQSILPFIASMVVFIAVVLLYFYVRLAYLLVPISTAEKKFGVFQSWQLTSGNFWRIFAILLATLLPLFAIEMAIYLAVYGSHLMHLFSLIRSHPTDPGAWIDASVGMMPRFNPLMWIVSIAIAPIMYGLMCGQSAFAYRALTASPPAAR